MNIKTKGMLFSLLLILFSTVVLGGGLYYRFEYILEDDVNRDMLRMAQEASDHIDSYLDQFVSPLISLSKNDDIASMNWQKQQVIIAEQIYSQYLNIAVVNLEGKAFYLDNTELDLSDREYIQETLSGNISFSDVIISRKTSKPAIMVGVPIYQGKDLKGALIARLDIDFLNSATHGYGDKGWAYIISNKGAIIAESFQEETEDSYNLYECAKNDDEYKTFANYVKHSIKRQTGFGKYIAGQKTVIMGYNAIPGTNWKIYIGAYESDLFSSLEMLKKMMIGIIAVSLLVCTVAAWIYVDRYTKPIIELEKQFSKGAQGDLTIRFTPETKDEIGKLGSSFNRMMDKIKTLTQYDPLTALLNTYVLEKDVETMVNSKNPKDFSLIMISIDKFSLINDTYGYTSGDEILIEITNRINACTSELHQIYRYKGDEFVVLCNDKQSIKAIDKLAKKILMELIVSYQIGSKIINISVSIGTFVWEECTRHQEPMIAVSQAKNYAKYLGGNQIQKFDQKIHHSIIAMKELQADILNGIKEEQFYLVYQPLFRLEDHDIAEVEALIRWNHPEKGQLYPDQFIDLAETTGSIISIDKWVLKTACKQLKTWKDNGKPRIMVSVNLSSKTFETSSFIPELIKLIGYYDVDPTLLQLEITERMLIKNVDESIQKLNELREMGIHVAIDDFGIGYSSLSYIVRLPVDSIKIDKSFVQNINSSKEAKAIVSSIINLCKTLNLNVVAEGIENQLELDYLKANQCDIGQGYYFSKPISIHEIENQFLR